MERSGITRTDASTFMRSGPRLLKKLIELCRKMPVRELAKISIRQTEYNCNGLLRELNLAYLDLSNFPNFKLKEAHPNEAQVAHNDINRHKVE